jgi:uncharacterized protein
MITVTLVEAWAERVTQRELQLPVGVTISDAFVAAGLAADEGDVGLWGKLVPLDTVLKDGDRLEQYRGLIADPKQARHQRANDQGYRWQGRTRRAARTG